MHPSDAHVPQAIDDVHAAAPVRKIGFLVSDGVLLLDIAGTGEAFLEANQAVPGYDVVLLSANGSDVVTSFGSRIQTQGAASDVTDLDTLIVPGSALPSDRYVTDELVAAARMASRGVRRVASVCTGAFVLAEAGLLRNRRVVTHWKFIDELARRYPDLEVHPDALHVRDGDVYTSAGATAGLDLALAMVEDDYDASVARRVAQTLLVHMQRSGGQSQFSVHLRTPVPHSPVVQLVTDFIKRHPGQPLTVGVLARAANVSPRHLTRLFHEELDLSPARYVADLRFDCAVALLDQGASIGDAAQRSGFGSADALRRAFGVRLGVSPSAYRRRLRPMPSPDQTVRQTDLADETIVEELVA